MNTEKIEDQPVVPPSPHWSRIGPESPPPIQITNSARDLRVKPRKALAGGGEVVEVKPESVSPLLR